MRLVFGTLVFSIAGGCEGDVSHRAASLPLLAVGAAAEPVEVWAHVRTVSPEGAVAEQIRTAGDATLLSRSSFRSEPLATG